MLRAAWVAVLASVGCGASINAVYEGDVRFERCMSIDTRADAKPTLRRACWDEWLRYYTFGQTRDRLDYAKSRAALLAQASDFDESWPVAPASAFPERTHAVPDPTSLIVPPPMLLAPAPGAPALGESAAPSGGAPTKGGR